MRKSIRWRLQLWYTLVLSAVVAGFAGILYFRVRAARFQEVDAALEAGALYLDASLRRFFPPQPVYPPPDHRPGRFPFEGPRGGGHGHPPPPPYGGPGMSWFGRPPPFQRVPDLERCLADLKLPEHGGGDDDRLRGAYFAVWQADGSLLKASGL